MATRRRKVSVIFFDETTGEELGSMLLPIEALNRSLEPGRTVLFRDAEWLVVDIASAPAPAPNQHHRVALRLRRLSSDQVTGAPYGHPTINRIRPVVGERLVGDRDLMIRADEWRQFEFVSMSFARDVDEEISNIRMVHDRKWNGLGWTERHIRTRPVHPIDRVIDVNDLSLMFTGTADPAGLAYADTHYLISDGFSLQVDRGLSIYGRVSGSAVTVLALQHGSGPISEPTVDGLKRLARRFGLDLVDWCRCIRTGPDSTLFDLLLSTQTVS